MTEPARPPDPPQPPVTVTPDPAAQPEASDRGERVGTILMIGAIAVVAVLIIDVATKGRLLAPLFALLPAPKPPVPEGPDAETRPAGE